MNEKKQGRPRFDDSLLKEVRERFPDVTTRLGQQSMVYAIQGYQILKDIPGLGFLWIFDEAGNFKDMKRTLIAEIGRFGDPETIKKVASRLCEEQKVLPKNIKGWVKKLQKVRKEKTLDDFLKGALSFVPCLTIKEFPNPGYGLAKVGTIIARAVSGRTNVVVPIRGDLPAGWALLLADNGMGENVDTGVAWRNEGGHLITSRTDPYIALYRTDSEYFKVTLEPGAQYAEAEILGNDLQHPSNKVRRLYDAELSRTLDRLRPMSRADLAVREVSFQLNFAMQQENKAIAEARANTSWGRLMREMQV